LGFGPRFFAPVCSGQSSSFFTIPEDIVVPGVVEVRKDGGVDVMIVALPEAGKGQSFPDPYDFESECPQCGATLGVLFN
jgi:hypothetical protein